MSFQLSLTTMEACDNGSRAVLKTAARASGLGVRVPPPPHVVCNPHLVAGYAMTRSKVVPCKYQRQDIGMQNM